MKIADSFPRAQDPVASATVVRLSPDQGAFVTPYYTARPVSSDGSLLVCTAEIDGDRQAWVIELQSGRASAVSTVEGGILMESATFHPREPWVFFAGSDSVWWHDLSSGRTELIYRTAAPFVIKSEISCGQQHLVFWIYETIDAGAGRDGRPPRHFHTLQQCRSYIISVEIATGSANLVWGDTAPLTHPVVHPHDDDIILFANQGTTCRLQELFTIHRVDRDNRKPLRLYPHYEALDQRPIYVGHSFFTSDGWVGCQLLEFGGRQPDGSYLDMIGFNAIVRADGTCQRRARCPGGNKPMHAHAASADGWWLGDTYPTEGGNDACMISVMKNNWETGYCQAEPLCYHGCTHRGYHAHPQFIDGGRKVLFNSDWRGRSQIYLVDVQPFFDRWQDRVTFDRRPSRFYQSQSHRAAPRAGPPV